jgi:hypothetical protein
MRFEDQEEVEAQLKELEYLVKKCRIHYEQFFMGNEKREPIDLRRKIHTFLKNSSLEKHRRAAIKFRYMTLTQKYVTLSNYWDRILRSMEDGTFNYMSYRGFRPRVTDEDELRTGVGEPEARRAVIDTEELERESIAHLAQHWDEHEPVDDGDAEAPPPAPEAVRGHAPPGLSEALAEALAEASREEPPLPARPEPPLPARPEPPLPSQRPTVVLDEPSPNETLTPPPPPVFQTVRPVPPSAARPTMQAPPSTARGDAPTVTIPRTPAPAASPPEAIEGLAGARHLYEKYRQAKVNAIADSEDLSYEQFEQRLVKKREMLKQKFHQDFEFDVLSRDGKVSIVAKKR